MNNGMQIIAKAIVRYSDVKNPIIIPNKDATQII
jgi:hypothetical protein